MRLPPPRATSATAARRATLLVLALVMGGCASWTQTEMTPQQIFAVERPEKVRVTTNDGTTTTLQQPRLLGNVLAGFEDGCMEDFGAISGRCEEMGVPIFEIESMEVLERGPLGQFAVAIVGLSVVWLLVNR